MWNQDLFYFSKSVRIHNWKKCQILIPEIFGGESYNRFRLQNTRMFISCEFFYAVLLLEYFLKATTQNKCRSLLKDTFLSRRNLKLTIQQQVPVCPLTGASMADGTELLFSFCNAPEMTQAGFFCVGVLLFMADPEILSFSLWSLLPTERRREALGEVC